MDLSYTPPPQENSEENRRENTQNQIGNYHLVHQICSPNTNGFMNSKCSRILQPNIGHGGRGVKRPWVKPQLGHEGRGFKRPWVEPQYRNEGRGFKRPWVEPQYRNEGRGHKKGYFQDPLNESCGVKKGSFQPWVEPEYPLNEGCEFQTGMYPRSLVEVGGVVRGAEGTLSPPKLGGSEKRTQREIDDPLLFEKLTMPLHVDVSLEYEVVDEITIPKDSAPLLIIHPDYQMQQQQKQEQGSFVHTFFGVKKFVKIIGNSSKHFNKFFPLTSPVESMLQNDQICSQSQNHPSDIYNLLHEVQGQTTPKRTPTSSTKKSSTDPQRTLLTSSPNKPPPGFHIRNILRQKGKRSQKTDPTNPLVDPQRTLLTDSPNEPSSGPQSGL